MPPTPGPGTYAAKKGVGAEGPKFIMGAKQDNKIKMAPGPGTYKPCTKETLKASANFSMGKNERKMLKEKNPEYPGPGTHKQASQLSGPKFGFGSSTRQKLVHDGSPGPGQYDYIS